MCSIEIVIWTCIKNAYHKETKKISYKYTLRPVITIYSQACESYWAILNKSVKDSSRIPSKFKSQNQQTVV